MFLVQEETLVRNSDSDNIYLKKVLQIDMTPSLKMGKWHQWEIYLKKRNTNATCPLERNMLYFCLSVCSSSFLGYYCEVPIVEILFKS